MKEESFSKEAIIEQLQEQAEMYAEIPSTYSSEFLVHSKELEETR